MIDESKIYVKYARDVLSDKIVACKYIKQACERFFSWFERDDMYFDYEDVDKKIRFVALLKHTEGEFAGCPFVLLPWQQFAFANIFGWKWTGGEHRGYRVTKKALMFISRKNGKSPMCSAMSLACATVDNEPGAEVDLLANTTKQAGVALRFAQNYAESVDKKQKVFKRFRSRINIPKTKSFVQVLSGDSMTADGYNSHVTILDELHAAKTWANYNVMISSQVMRRQPLMCVITSAGFLIGKQYPLYSMTETCKEILSGNKIDDTQFSLIYTLDEDDDWKDENVWIKANPSLGVTVKIDSLREQVQAAINNSSLEVGVKTKNLNLFCQAKDIWISNDLLLQNSQQIDLEDFRDEECYMGVDLSSVSDLTAVTVLFPPNENRNKFPDKYVFKSFMYVPQDALENSSNANYYERWIRAENLKCTSGNVVDYDEVLKDIMHINQIAIIDKIAYDSWNATQFAINATAEGLPLEPFSQSLGSFNRGTKEFERLLKMGKIVLDNNECVRWQIGNCQLKSDWNDNVKPVKAQGNKLNKIDAVISMLEALGIYLNSPQYEPTVFTL